MDETGAGIRDRRLMTIGVLAALGQSQLVEIQFQSALDRGELTEDQVRETVVHLPTTSAGPCPPASTRWPNG